MNIQDKDTFYREIYRVLKPNGGKLVFHDVLRGDDITSKEASPRYPCPWAETEDLSHLVTEAEMRKHVESAGFVIAEWEDQTEKTVAWFRKQRRSSTAGARRQDDYTEPSLGMHLIMGDTAPIKMQNHRSNCELRRTVVVMGVLIK